MIRKVNPQLIKEIKKYGSFDISLCFNCGNCTAICPLSKDDLSFPREVIRYAQIGDLKAIESSLQPWICYYCGECSQTCPRQAYPGEFMMSLRRYLISRYDLTGISKIFYLKPWLQNFLIVIIFIISFLFFISYQGDFQSLAHKIEFFFPIYVTISVIGYVFMMYKNIILEKTKKFVLSFKPILIKEAIIHAITQKNFLSCYNRDILRWLSHIVVVVSYVFILLISNLHMFKPLKIHYDFFDLVSILIFISSIGLFLGVTTMIYRRIIKKTESSRFSHSSDWMFLFMLFLISSTLFLSLFLNILYGPDNILVSLFYKFNIAIEISWIVFVVPFTKWIHMVFRPFSVYLYELKKEVKDA